MNFFKNRFEEHGVHGLLSNLEKAVADYDVDLPDEGSERETYERFRRVLKFTRASLSTADPVLTSPAALDALNNRLSNLNNTFNNFRNNKNWNALMSACDELLGQFHVLPRRDPVAAEKEWE